MSNLTLSIIGNQIFSEIIDELKLFTKFKIKFYHNLSLFKGDFKDSEELFIFFLTESNKKDCEKIIKNNLPLIIINKTLSFKLTSSGDFVEFLNMPFKILDLEKKIISLSSKFKFRKSSLINLRGYTIDKNERKIKKDSLELQLTEKEISFLILFAQNNKPLTRNFLLKNVWNYSSTSETHTIETHIHRLRKKILEKFNDNNFIKNNNNGYYI